MFCLCGHELKPDAQFCTKCGTKITRNMPKEKKKSSGTYKYAAAGALLAVLVIAGFFAVQQITLESGIASYSAADFAYLGDAYTSDAFINVEEVADESSFPQMFYLYVVGDDVYELEVFCTREYGKRVATEFLSNFTTLFLGDWMMKYNFHRAMLGFEITEFGPAVREFLHDTGRSHLMLDSWNSNPIMVPQEFYSDLSLDIFNFASGFLLFDIHENGIPLIAVIYDSWVADRTWDCRRIYTLFSYNDGSFVEIGEMESPSLWIADNEGNIVTREFRGGYVNVSFISFNETIEKEIKASIPYTITWLDDFAYDLCFDRTYYLAPGMPITGFSNVSTMPELTVQIREYLTPIMQQRAEEAIANPPTPTPAMVDLRLRHDMTRALQSAAHRGSIASSYVYFGEEYALLIALCDAIHGFIAQSFVRHGTNFFIPLQPHYRLFQEYWGAFTPEVTALVHPDSKNFTLILYVSFMEYIYRLITSQSVLHFTPLGASFERNSLEDNLAGMYMYRLGWWSQPAIDRLMDGVPFTFNPVAAGVYRRFY